MLLAAVMFLHGLPLSVARETASESDIDIVVHPSDFTPAPPTGTSGAPGTSASLGLRPGTVSARFVEVRESDQTERTDDDAMILIIRDDRGRASGWQVSTTYTALIEAGDAVDLIEGQSNTILRVLPDRGSLLDQVSPIQCGRTLGPLSLPMPLLDAAPGSGSGVFLQQIVVILPELDPGGDAGTLVVQIPFAP